MIRNVERKFIYTVYILLIAWALIFVARATAWDLKVEDGRAVSPPECKLCLANFATCMQLVDDSENEYRDPREYVASKLACVKYAEKCGIDNKCKTRVVRDEK